jgi:protocatechuate 3,4-dioxygenase, alpha subunit
MTTSGEGQTPSQTVGPYFAMRLSGPGENVLVAEGTPGRIVVRGTVLDGDRRPIEDALLELWQAGPDGRYRHPDDTGIAADGEFSGFGRCPSAFETGEYVFTTVKPGPVDGQAPHLALVVQARGMLAPSFTRVYFADEGQANVTDPVLAAVPEPRRSTLIAELVGDGEYRFDIRFQGGDETVFFDV